MNILIIEDDRELCSALRSQLLARNHTADCCHTGSEALYHAMSGAYDLAVFIEGKTLREVAGFVSEKLSVMDKVLSTRKENVDVPGEWRRIIENENGEWKKIILYNNSVSALLQHEDKMLVKMQDVFRIFKENKDEVALLWRPHPLIKATIESMRPELWERYQEIVKKYKEEGWGIYDDTAELDRAIALSDAYYGDYSSLVQLCQETGKPVMIQDVEISG